MVYFYHIQSWAWHRRRTARAKLTRKQMARKQTESFLQRFFVWPILDEIKPLFLLASMKKKARVHVVQLQNWEIQSWKKKWQKNESAIFWILNLWTNNIYRIGLWSKYNWEKSSSKILSEMNHNNWFYGQRFKLD